MPDWTKSMEQTFEYYIVDPSTWRDKVKLDNVKKASVVRDSTVDTLGSASFTMMNTVGECYVREYLVVKQNGLKERIPLGTHLIQTPSSEFDGKVRSATIDAYTPLLELKENPPPLGYASLAGENITQSAEMIAREHARAPIVGADSSEKLYTDFVANSDDSWLTYVRDLLTNANYELELDEMGRILFAPQQDIASLQPVMTYSDDNSSLLYPEITTKHDLYGVPNVVEVVYSKTGSYYYARVVNDDVNSPTSTVNRGREIIKRVTDLSLPGEPTEAQVKEYAELLLRNLSSIEYTASYTHGYCGTRVGDCVRLNYERAGLVDIKAKIVSQTIKCEPGCPVSERAVYTVKLWR